MNDPGPSNIIRQKMEFFEDEDQKDAAILLQAAFPRPDISVKSYISRKKSRGNLPAEIPFYVDTENYIVGDHQLKLFEIVSDYCLNPPDGFPLIHYRPNEKHGYWFKTTLNTKHWEEMCKTLNGHIGSNYNCATVRRAFINFKNRCLTNMATLPSHKWTQPRDFDFYRLFHYKLGFLKEENPIAYDDPKKLELEVVAYLKSNPIPAIDESKIKKRYPKKPRMSSDLESFDIIDQKFDFSPSAFGENLLASILPSTSFSRLDDFKNEDITSQISRLIANATAGPAEDENEDIQPLRDWSKTCLLTEIGYLTKKVCVKLNEYDDPGEEMILPNADSTLPGKKIISPDTFLDPNFRRNIKTRLKQELERKCKEFNATSNFKALLLTDSLLQAFDENAIENLRVIRTEFPILPRWIPSFLTSLNPKTTNSITILCLLGFDFITHMENPEFYSLKIWLKNEFSGLVDYTEEKKNFRLVLVTIPEIGDLKTHFQWFNLALKDFVYEEAKHLTPEKINLIDWNELIMERSSDISQALTFDRRLNLLFEKFSNLYLS